MASVIQFQVSFFVMFDSLIAVTTNPGALVSYNIISPAHLTDPTILWSF